MKGNISVTEHLPITRACLSAVVVASEMESAVKVEPCTWKRKPKAMRCWLSSAMLIAHAAGLATPPA